MGTTGYNDPHATIFYSVDSTGSSRMLVGAFEANDINLAKDRVVAIDLDTDRAVVLDSFAKVLGRTEKAVANPEQAAVGFVEEEVLIVTTDSKEKQEAVRWDPDTSKTKKVTAPELLDAAVSPGGSFRVGNVPGTDDERPCIGVASDERAQQPQQWQALPLAQPRRSTSVQPRRQQNLSRPKSR